MSSFQKRQQTELEHYFETYRKKTIGINHQFESVYGTQNLLYADWIASGRLYRPIEDIICNKIGPLMANTHSFSSESGKAATYTYQEARRIIKNHVNANANDVLVTTGSGMTGALAKLQRIMGLNRFGTITDENDRPVIFISHMEHHSNQVSWQTLKADVVLLQPDESLQINPLELERQLLKYKDRKLKIGSFTACSNVTGTITDYYELAQVMHSHNGFCFVDFAASAPYEAIDMHPENPKQKLDAIFFSPHKFLGGPGSSGVLVYDKKLHKNPHPDTPGGGNVKWTNPLGNFGYHQDLEIREDGGTPGILQVIRTALCIRLKEQMNPILMKAREKELSQLFYNGIQNIPEVANLSNPNADSIGCIAFNIIGMHYNLVVRLLNDRFGIQTRGGWSCASSFAHYLMQIETEKSTKLINEIENHQLANKPGWVRLSLHPIMTDAEVLFIIKAIKEIIANNKEWEIAYNYNQSTNEFDSIWQDDRELQKRMHSVFQEI
ncbi:MULTISPECIES: aminotransferase class V-fold PLP-dependent enzyme [unclassified Leeuwenhoekiella]|uniref:aminotransferase class V-fold PLP-dependent enzyme n=1 Tax=unclassified Leeuwenhoekiella TaxID=2615029 RepID=UPI000C68879C|nr:MULTISPECIES: aminotransferase class V-fold PLP-dependent enzyme [unclassified Leeuwenhoekiella]MAW95416.1 selenocysteine lyase [Leeuwenhoekiella sp.]MBA80803.1 selenocysteine lyase [Leeuwenhoekiella sp.]|tara:strand:+ start:6828 stop:8312 length:1485 start_codon:yes stop_codon:yes gene_type:complete